jgi:muramidase (phage lysozyme)
MAVVNAAQAGGTNVPKFLDLLSVSEGTSTHQLTKNDGYDVIVTGDHAAGEVGLEVFTDYSRHPFAAGRPGKIFHVNPIERSTASGRYQILCRYALAYELQLHLTDFSPLSQDLMAIQQIRERHDANKVSALQHVINGEIEVAIGLCSNIWASLPGNSYGQGGRSMASLMNKWNESNELKVAV